MLNAFGLTKQGFNLNKIFQYNEAIYRIINFHFYP